MAANPTDPESPSPRPANSRYRSAQSTLDADGRRVGNYETFPVAAPGAPRPEIPPAGRKKYGPGAEAPNLTLSQAIRSLTWDDFKSLPRQVCVRESFLAGIMSGFLVGGTRAILGAPVAAAANWAVGAFACGSVAAHEVCQYRRFREVEGMQKAVEVLHAKRRREREEKAKADTETESQTRQDEQPHMGKENQSQRKWWSFWASSKPPDR